MHLIQFENIHGQRRVGRVEADHVFAVHMVTSMHMLALQAIRMHCSLAERVEQLGATAYGETLSALLQAGRVLPPLDHADTHHCLLTGTGLTHTGSATTRDDMHAATHDPANTPQTDSMRMFQWGIDGGRPSAGQAGVQPEWFYKGHGGIVARPGGELEAPAFGRDLGEEAEIAGLYIIGDDGQPYRLGFAIANEASDHATERSNYLYLAHSKLRHCAFGPVLLTGALPQRVEGTSRIHRNGAVLWQRPFVSGEAHMCHSLDNLEYHHFKYAQFLTPGDVHVHFFGTATLSCTDDIRTRPGDTFEIDCPLFGPPLTNTMRQVEAPLSPGDVHAL